MRCTVTTEKELANAINNDSVSEIEIKGDLKEKVVKIRAKGKVAWAIAVGAITIAVLLIISSPVTLGTQSIVSLPALGPAVAVLGVGVTLSAVQIAAAAGGVAILAYIREGMKVVDEGSNYIVLKKEDIKSYDSFAKIYNAETINTAEKMFVMGKDYYEGNNGMPKNKDMALYCLKQAAELGSESAKQYLKNRGYQF